MVATDSLRRPRGVHALVGAVCAVFSVGVLLTLPVLTADDPQAASLIAVPPGSVRWWLVVVGLVVQGLVLVWAAVALRPALLAVAAVAAVAVGLSLAAPGAAYGITSLAVMVLVFRVVVGLPLVRAIPTLASAGLLVAIGQSMNSLWGEGATPGGAVIGGVVQTLAVIAIPLLLGVLVRSRNEVREARQDERQARVEQRDAQVEAAVSRERTAMARELHDIAAHHLSGIALMAAVVDRQIDTAPEEAHRGVQQVRAQSTAVLDDLRRLVGLLRDERDGGRTGERSVEALAAVPELVESARAQGPILLDVRTDPGRGLGTGIGPLAQLALYRTVQEALTNAATHAPGAARTVEIDDRDATRVVVTVTNAPSTVAGHRSAAGGFGLVGMRERAELVGADLRCGPTRLGGWQVRASVVRETTGRSPATDNTRETRDPRDTG